MHKYCSNICCCIYSFFVHSRCNVLFWSNPEEFRLDFSLSSNAVMVLITKNVTLFVLHYKHFKEIGLNSGLESEGNIKIIDVDTKLWWLRTSLHTFYSCVWCRGFKKRRRLVDTLTFDTLNAAECPDPNTPTHSPLLGNMAPILVRIRFGWDKASSEACR